MTKTARWTLLVLANIVAIAGASYLVSISGRLAGVVPSLLFIFILDLRAIHQLLQPPAAVRSANEKAS